MRKDGFGMAGISFPSKTGSVNKVQPFGTPL
jgi:hypothetical protein